MATNGERFWQGGREVPYNVMDFEGIVRPWGQPNFRPASSGTKREPTVAGNAVLTFGSAGSNVFQLNAQFSGQDTNKADDKKEITRKFDVVRVKNPDSPDQHVDVEVMSEYTARNKIDQKRTKLAFSRVEPQQNLEILSRNNTRTTGDDN